MRPFSGFKNAPHGVSSRQKSIAGWSGISNPATRAGNLQAFPQTDCFAKKNTCLTRFAAGVFKKRRQIAAGPGGARPERFAFSPTAKLPAAPRRDLRRRAWRGTLFPYAYRPPPFYLPLPYETDNPPMHTGRRKIDSLYAPARACIICVLPFKRICTKRTFRTGTI